MDTVRNPCLPRDNCFKMCIRERCNNLHFVCAARENTQNLDAQNLKKGEIKDFYPDTLMQKTCFNIPLLDNLLSNYLDKQFVEYLIRGLKEGFNNGKKVEQSSL